MSLKQRGSFPLSNRIIGSVLAVAGIAGWGAYAHSSLSRAVLQEQLRAQAAALEDYQTQFTAERQKAEESAKAVGNLRNALSAAQQEMQRLKSETDSELAKLRDQVAAAAQPGLSQVGGLAPEILGIKPRPTKQDVMAAQEALTQLRFGALKADGELGPSTREAIEAFQRAAGLQVTGELQAQTLLALTRAAKVMAAQSERLDQPL